MSRFIWLCLVLGLAAVQPTATALAAPDGYTHILAKEQTFEFEGHEVTVPFQVWVKPRFQEDAAFFDLWVEADLSSIQERAPDIMAASNSYDRCGDNITVSNVRIVPRAPRAQLCANVYHVRYQCLMPPLPFMKGFALSIQRRTARTALVKHSASVCADLRAEIVDEGRSVSLEGKVTQTSVSGNSGLFGIMFDTRNQFRSKLRSKINRALTDLRLLVPDALQPFGPIVNSAEFVEREEGVLGLDMTMTVNVTPEEVPKLLQMLLASTAQAHTDSEAQ